MYATRKNVPTKQGMTEKRQMTKVVLEKAGYMKNKKEHQSMNC